MIDCLIFHVHARLVCISPSTISCVFVYCALLHGGPLDEFVKSSQQMRPTLARGTTVFWWHSLYWTVSKLLPDGVHPIALLDEVENYKRLQLAHCDIAAEVKDLEVLTVDGKTLQV